MTSGRYKIRPKEYDRIAFKTEKYRKDDLKRMVYIAIVHVKNCRAVGQKNIKNFGCVSVELAECMRNEWFRIKKEMGDDALDISNVDRIIDLLERFKAEKYDPLVEKISTMQPCENDDLEMLQDRVKILEIQNQKYRKMAEKFKRERDKIKALYQEQPR